MDQFCIDINSTRIELVIFFSFGVRKMAVAHLMLVLKVNTLNIVAVVHTKLSAWVMVGLLKLMPAVMVVDCVVFIVQIIN